MYLADIYTVTASLAGIHGMSAPCGQSSQGLAIGPQIMGKHFDESPARALPKRSKVRPAGAKLCRVEMKLKGYNEKCTR